MFLLFIIVFILNNKNIPDGIGELTPMEISGYTIEEVGRKIKQNIILYNFILSAKSEENANAYWQGKDIYPHSSEIWDN